MVVEQNAISTTIHDTEVPSGIPELSESVTVQIYREEYVERFITFIYPKPKIEVDVRRVSLPLIRLYSSSNKEGTTWITSFWALALI